MFAWHVLMNWSATEFEAKSLSTYSCGQSDSQLHTHTPCCEAWQPRLQLLPGSRQSRVSEPSFSGIAPAGTGIKSTEEQDEPEPMDMGYAATIQESVTEAPKDQGHSIESYHSCSRAFLM